MAETRIFSIRYEGLEDAQKKLDDVTKSLVRQEEAVRETKKEIREIEKANGGSTEASIELRQELLAQQDNLKQLRAERRASVKELENSATAINAATGSNEQLRAELSLMTERYNSLSGEERDRATVIDQVTGEEVLLRDAIKGTSDQLKENESAVGDNRRNVGNYEEAVTNALSKVNLFGVNLGAVKAQLEQQLVALKASTTGTAAQATATTGAATATTGFSATLKALRIALISTGIGAIVVALGALGAAFASTQQGADLLRREANRIKFIMEALWGVVQNLSTGAFAKLQEKFSEIKELGIAGVFKAIGDAIVQNVINRFQAVGDLFGALGQAFNALMNRDFAGAKDALVEAGDELTTVYTGIDEPFDKASNAVEQFGEFVSETADVVRDANERSLEYTATQTALEQALIDNATAISQANREFREQRIIVNDATKTIRERIAASEAAEAALSRRAELQKEEIELEIQLLKNRQQNNDTMRAGEGSYQELAALEAKLIDIEAQRSQELTRLTSRMSSLQLEERKRLATIAEIIGSEQERLDLERDLRLEELELNRETTELTDEELRAREAIIQEYADKRAEIAREAAEAEQEAHFEGLQAQVDRIATENELAALQLEEQRNIAIAAAIERGESVEAVEREYDRRGIEMTREMMEAQRQVLELELNNLTASLDGGVAGAVLTEEQREQVELQIQALNTKLASIGVQMAQIGRNPETGEPQDLPGILGMDPEDIEHLEFAQEQLMTGIDALSDVFQAASQSRINRIRQEQEEGRISAEEADRQIERINEQAARRQRTISIVQAIINTSVGVTKALAALPPPFSFIQAAAVGAQGAAQVAAIRAQKFATGGILSGPSHAQGGIQVFGRGGYFGEAEGGEAIINRQSTAMFRPLLSAINEAGGGRAFANGGILSPPSIATNISGASTAPSRGVVEGLQNMPAPVITEAEITKRQSRVAIAEAERTIG